MSLIKKLAAGAAMTTLAGMAASAAWAQSTGTAAVEEVVITAQQNVEAGGLIKRVEVPKSRATLTQEFITTQSAGQSALQLVNLLPGLNFTNNDPYGSSGGNVRIRGFDNNRISLTQDGMPLNDTGNYAIFSNQQLDSDLIDTISVNQGTTDVDSPTASATGGTINYTSRATQSEFGGFLQGSVGDFSYGRVIGLLDTGKIGPWGTMAWVAASYQKYDKFKGSGELEKKQFNARVYQPIGENGDFISVAAHYNENRNAFYRNPTKAQYAADRFFENDATCARPTAGAGTVQNEGSAPFSNCTNYFNLRVNPSNTGNIRGQSKFTLPYGLTLTVDPSFQYVLANGGGTTVLSETSAQLRGSSAAAGVDLNGDGDVLDSVRLYSPNTTNTRRYGLTSSLIWDLNADHRLRAAYTLDYGKHRQTGEFTFLDAAGKPADVFGGKDGNGPKVRTADGSWIRQRDRYSVAQLQQLALEYRGLFIDQRLGLNVGVRLPYFTRELNNYCYTQPNGFAYCSTQPPATVIGNIPPFQGAEKKYDDVLPNVGIWFRPWEGSQIYASYAAGLSAPRTDNLYSFSIPNIQPETTDTYELGYRYRKGSFYGQAVVWSTKFQNRIVSSYDQDLGINIDRNVGEVDLSGVELQASWEPVRNLNLYASASFIDSEIADNFRISPTQTVLTSGKSFVETPESQYAGRAQYEIGPFTMGLSGKYVGDRFSTDNNDESVAGYTVLDADLRMSLDEWLKGTYVQFNVTNIFDERYLAGISSTPNATGVGGRAPTYTVGAPRTVQATIRAAF